MKINTEQLEAIQSKRGIIENARTILKEDFVGIDQIIDNIITQIESWFLIPEYQDQPLLINMWGLTGVGKTALIRRLIELLSFEERSVSFDLGEFASSNSRLTSFKEALTSQKNILHQKSSIIILDEFQLGRTINRDGGEIDRDNLRAIWELIDTGKVAYTPAIRFTFMADLRKLAKKLHKCKLNGVQIKNGKIVEGFDFYRNLFSEELAPDSMDHKDIDASNCYAIPSEYYDTLLDEQTIDLLTHAELLSFFDKTQDLQELIAFVEGVQSSIEKIAEIDLSKSLIFVIGNLDELFQMASNYNPQIDPDYFHKQSLKIKLPQLKQVLRSRFRNEQIARLGNNHIIYPAMNNAMYKDLIALILKKLSEKVEQKYQLITEFSKSAHQLIFNEAIYPTQGARPVIQMIQSTIEPLLIRSINTYLVSGESLQKIKVSFKKRTLIFKIFDKDEIQIAEYSYPIELKTYRKDNSNKNELSLIAVHEAGHAVCASILFRMIPEEVVSVTSDPDSAGYTLINYPEGQRNKRIVMDNITVALGGYMAERIVFGELETSTGVFGDIIQATEMASAAIKKMGMGKDVLYVTHPDAFNDESYTNTSEYEEESREMVRQCLESAKIILLRNKEVLLQLAHALCIKSKLKKQSIERIMKQYAEDEWVRTTGFDGKNHYYVYQDILETQLKKLESARLQKVG